MVSVETQLSEMRRQLDYLVAKQKKQEELLEEMTPILQGAMSLATERLADLEARGYFAFGRQSLQLLDKVVAGFTPEDVERLGDNVVTILQTVKSVTQPEVLQVVDEAALSVSEGGEEPVGLLGMLRKGHDEDVRRGIAVMLSLLRQVGRSAGRASDGRRKNRRRLHARLAPRRTAAPEPPRPTMEDNLAPSAPALRIAGVETDAEGFLVDHQAWSHDVADRIAEAVGIPSLTDRHWQVIEFAREEFEAKGKSPNVRRLASGSGLTTKDIYTLFVRAPGKTAARIAGLPKPVGCI